MDREERIDQHESDIEKLKQSVAILQEDRERLWEVVNEMKDDVKYDISQLNSNLRGDIKTLREDIQQTMKRASEAWPMWASAAVALLGVVVAVMGYFHV